MIDEKEVMRSKTEKNPHEGRVNKWEERGKKKKFSKLLSERREEGKEEGGSSSFMEVEGKLRSFFTSFVLVEYSLGTDEILTTRQNITK